MTWRDLTTDIAAEFAIREGIPPRTTDFWDGMYVVHDEEWTSRRAERQKGYYQANKTRILAQQKEYRRKNAARVALLQKIRRAK